MSTPTYDEIYARLASEIAVIAGTVEENVKPGVPLSQLGINSMGFVELLIAAGKIWHVDLVESGVSPRDVSGADALAKRIQGLLEK